MSDVEREYLDDYLASQKAKTDPDADDAEFFAHFCISQILKPRDIDIDDEIYGYTAGEHDGGIDGIYFFVAGQLVTEEMEPLEFADHEGLTMSLEIIQATRTPRFTAEQIRKFEDTSKDLLDLRKDVDAKSTQYNPELRVAMKRFRRWWEALKIKLPTLTIIFNIASKGDEVHKHVRDRANDFIAVVKSLYPCECTVEYYNAKMLLEMAKKSRRQPVELRFQEELKSEHWGRAYCLLVPLTAYANFLLTPPPSRQRREYIFEPNVRSFLGSKGVNAEIFETLVRGSAKKEEFWWLNNGVTITASKITPDIHSLILEDARIVNGLQTSRVIANYYQQKPKQAEKDERHVIVKVIQADKATARHILNTTNSQSKIDPTYLRITNDDLHDRIDSAFPKYGFHYERVKNQYYDDGKIPRSAIITPKYLTRALIAMLLQEPDQARGRPDKYTENNYGKLFARNSKPAMFANVVTMMKKVDVFVSTHVPVRNDQNNLKYYVATDVVCSALKRSRIQRGMLANLKTEKITDDLLQKSLDRVERIYGVLIAKGQEADLVAKGKDMARILRDLLADKYPMKVVSRMQSV